MMGKYKKNPANIVEDTERARIRPQRDKQMDGQVETNIPAPQQLRCAVGIKKNIGASRAASHDLTL